MAIKGIDVSKWNGNVDFNKVKKAGYDFVIIRAGYGKQNIDPKFKQNIQKAKAAGLKIGAYWFIYAKNRAELYVNCELCYATLISYMNDLEMGLWADWEYDSDKYMNAKITSHERALYVKYFIDKMEQFGFKCGLYANPDYINNKFDMSVFKGVDLWLAYYGATDEKAKAYNPKIWQFTDKGQINGILGNVDCNYYYGDAPEKPQKAPKWQVKTNGGNLMVRKDKNAKSAILAKIKNGTYIDVIDNSGTWYKINYNGIIGYSSSKYIKEI